jgi:hypothetical protein
VSDVDTETESSTCLECGAPVVNRGGGSWTHTAKIRGRNHPAYPAPVNAEEATR